MQAAVYSQCSLRRSLSPATGDATISHVATHCIYTQGIPWKCTSCIWCRAMINSGQYNGQSQLGSRLDAFCNMQNAYNPKANDKG